MDLSKFYVNPNDCPNLVTLVDDIAVDNQLDQELDTLLPVDDYLGRRPSMITAYVDPRTNPMVAERLGSVFTDTGARGMPGLTDAERISVIPSRFNTTKVDEALYASHLSSVFETDIHRDASNDAPENQSATPSADGDGTNGE